VDNGGLFLWRRCAAIAISVKASQAAGRHELEDNIGRCTGRHNIAKSVPDVAGRMKVSQAAG